MNIVEKRAEKRVQSKLPISFVTQDNHDVVNMASSFNLSVEGICLETNVALPLNSIIELKLPTSFGNLNLQAVIVWNRLNEYGCHFINMDLSSISTLKQWLFPPFEP